MTFPPGPVALAVGDRLATSTFGPVTRTDIVRYTGAGGDLNPIHHDEPYARAAGHPGTFAPGLLAAGVAGLRLARWVGPAQVRTYAVRFTGQVWPGDVLRFDGEVTGRDGDVATIALTATRQTGDLALRATAAVTAAPAPRPPALPA